MNTLKRIFHLLCDYRNFTWRGSRFVNLWVSWHPRIGFSFDFYVDFIPGDFIPGHRCDPNDEDDSGWGAEFRFGGGLLWLDFPVTGTLVTPALEIICGHVIPPYTDGSSLDDSRNRAPCRTVHNGTAGLLRLAHHTPHRTSGTS